MFVSGIHLHIWISDKTFGNDGLLRAQSSYKPLFNAIALEGECDRGITCSMKTRDDPFGGQAYAQLLRLSIVLAWFYFAYLCVLCDVQDAQMPQAHGCASAAGEKVLTAFRTQKRGASKGSPNPRFPKERCITYIKASTSKKVVRVVVDVAVASLVFFALI